MTTPETASQTTRRRVVGSLSALVLILILAASAVISPVMHPGPGASGGPRLDSTADLLWVRGLSGTITARRYVDGKAGEDAAAGLLLASVDQEVEDVLLGIASADGIEGALKSSEVKTSRAMRWLARGLRRPRGGKS